MASSVQESLNVCQVRSLVVTVHTPSVSPSALQPQERNIANKIFGGYLMRKAAELAFSCAFMYARSQPSFVALDGASSAARALLRSDSLHSDITFIRPVEIGNLLKLRSQVIFSQGNHLMVEVEATVHDPLKAERHLTNRFYFTFVCPDSKGDLPIVMPQTYEEGTVVRSGISHVAQRCSSSRASVSLSADCRRGRSQTRCKCVCFYSLHDAVLLDPTSHRVSRALGYSTRWSGAQHRDDE